MDSEEVGNESTVSDLQFNDVDKAKLGAQLFLNDGLVQAGSYPFLQFKRHHCHVDKVASLLH
jgi:hypothetical protein